jgi:hypothetical protein
MAADFQHFSWQRDNSLKEDESNDIQQPQPSYSIDSPFNIYFDCEDLWTKPPLGKGFFKINNRHGFKVLTVGKLTKD